MRWLALLVALLAACGSVKDKKVCATSASCGAGSYCAHTPDGAVCWPDAVLPAVGSVTVTCDTNPCQRDGTLSVSVTASDDAELASVEVKLDLDLATTVVLTQGAGNLWTAQLSLRVWPFAAFHRDVVATATARDGAQNEASANSAPIPVTRLRWAVEAKAGSSASLSPPAIQADGTVVVGNANHELLFLTLEGGQAANPLPVGTGAISSVAVGARAIWVGSEDNAVRAVNLDRSAVLAGVTVNVDGPIKGGLAVRSDATEEWAFAGGEGGRLGAASTSGLIDRTGLASFRAGPLLTGDGRVCAVAYALASELSCFSFDGALNPLWSTQVGSNVVAGLGADASNAVWTASGDAKVNRTSDLGATVPVATLPGGVEDGPVLINGGDAIVSDSLSGLHRVTAGGAAVWTPPRTLDGIPLTPLALSGGPARLLVGTRNGWVYALADDGTTLWSEQVVTGPQFKGTNISFPSIATPVTSTAYFSASNGKVYAVVVDGTLDTASPWPKAFHDRRNTSNAGAAQ